VIDDKLLRPGHPDFAAQCTGFNLLTVHRPDAVLIAASADDVAAGVAYAASRGWQVAVQNTGHGPAAPMDGGLLISLRLLNGVQIDGRTARVQGGSRWRHVMQAAAPRGLAPLAGSAPEVGVVGYLTGGGLPLLGRAHGFGADRVTAVELVTANGEQLRATAQQHPDLFWAVRGGKGNFGVVTSVEVELLPITEILGGQLAFDAARAAEVLPAYLAWTDQQPDAMDSSLALLRFPDVEQLPPHLRGQLILTIRVAYSGAPEDGEPLVKALRALGPRSDTVTTLGSTEFGKVYNDPTEPGAGISRSGLLRPLDDAAVARILDFFGPDAPPVPALFDLRHLGGALAHQPDVPNAISYRDAAFTMMVAGQVPAPQALPAVQGHQQAIFDALSPWLTGGMIPTALGPGERTVEQVAAAYSQADYQRLAAIKHTYDPNNMFRANHNIPPAADH
jgi:FAD/FMN-containing dehydrogenase